MARQNKRRESSDRKPRSRSRYKQVNVWKKYFGPIAVSAVFDVYAQAVGIPYLVAKKKDFMECLDYLRKLEYPEYIPYSKR